MPCIEDPREREIGGLSRVAVSGAVDEERRVSRLAESPGARVVDAQRQRLSAVPVADVVGVAVPQGDAHAGLEELFQLGQELRVRVVARGPEGGRHFRVDAPRVVGRHTQRLLDFSLVEVFGEQARWGWEHGGVAHVVCVSRRGVRVIWEFDRAAAHGVGLVADHVADEGRAVAESPQILAQADQREATVVLHVQRELHVRGDGVVDFHAVRVVQGEGRV